MKWLGIRFNNTGLLKQALTHRSYSRQKDKNGSVDNERLEFLGDAVLKLLVSEYLFLRFPNLDEGDLTKIRAKLVSDRNFSYLAREIELGKHILFSQGEKKSGGAERLSNLANAFEAVIGAIYLDRGLEVTRIFFCALIDKHYDNLVVDELLEDYKTQLQEFLQREKSALPTYTVLGTSGPDHHREFKIQVSFSSMGRRLQFEGKGYSKKSAEQSAARQALLELGAKSG